MDKFTAAYIEAALWFSIDDAGEPLGQSDAELADETRAKMEADCARFQTEQAEWLAEDLPNPDARSRRSAPSPNRLGVTFG